MLVDANTVLCQFKARSAANGETVILQGFFISRVEKRYNSLGLVVLEPSAESFMALNPPRRITEQQHYWSLTAIERHQQRRAADHSSPVKPPPIPSSC